MPQHLLPYTVTGEQRAPVLLTRALCTAHRTLMPSARKVTHCPSRPGGVSMICMGGFKAGGKCRNPGCPWPGMVGVRPRRFLFRRQER